jgi:hypothetical protein
MTLIHDHEVCPRCTHPRLKIAHIPTCPKSSKQPTTAAPHWEAKAPAKPGWYWYRDAYQCCEPVQLLGKGPYWETFQLPGQETVSTAEDMLRNDGEFWSEKLEEPK